MSDTPNKSPNNNKPKPRKPGANNNNKKRYSGNKNRRPKTLTPARILQKYDNLMEQYILARKKFYEMQGRGNPKQVDKVDRNYRTSLKNLRTFEAGLLDWQKEVLKGKIDAYPPDRQYTSEHNIEPVGDQVAFTGDFEDPHLLTTQVEHSWSEDTEETQGTIEDYNGYKGIVSQ